MNENIMQKLLTQSNLCLHGHGQCWVLDFTAEQSVIIQLRVEGPSESSLHHHRAITLRDVSVAEVVERVGAVHPAGELAAHHRLGDDLCRRARLVRLLTLSVDSLGGLSVQTSRPTFGVQKGEGPLQLSVIEVPADERSGSSHPRCTTSLLTGGGLSV